jgi:hypothetical protein
MLLAPAGRKRTPLQSGSRRLHGKLLLCITTYPAAHPSIHAGVVGCLLAAVPLLPVLPALYIHFHLTASCLYCLQTLRSSFMPGGKSLEELQSEYTAARSMVMTQLRQAKDEAERERRAILLRINRALTAGRWA